MHRAESKWQLYFPACQRQGTIYPICQVYEIIITLCLSPWLRRPYLYFCAVKKTLRFKLRIQKKIVEFYSSYYGGKEYTNVYV